MPIDIMWRKRCYSLAVLKWDDAAGLIDVGVGRIQLDCVGVPTTTSTTSSAPTTTTTTTAAPTTTSPSTTTTTAPTTTNPATTTQAPTTTSPATTTSGFVHGWYCCSRKDYLDEYCEVESAVVYEDACVELWENPADECFYDAFHDVYYKMGIVRGPYASKALCDPNCETTTTTGAPTTSTTDGATTSSGATTTGAATTTPDATTTSGATTTDGATTTPDATTTGAPGATTTAALYCNVYALYDDPNGCINEDPLSFIGYQSKCEDFDASGTSGCYQGGQGWSRWVETKGPFTSLDQCLSSCDKTSTTPGATTTGPATTTSGTTATTTGAPASPCCALAPWEIPTYGDHYFYDCGSEAMADYYLGLWTSKGFTAINCYGEGCNNTEGCLYQIMNATKIWTGETWGLSYDLAYVTDNCNQSLDGCCYAVMRYSSNYGATYDDYCQWGEGCDPSKLGCSYARIGEEIGTPPVGTLGGYTWYQSTGEDCDLVMGACCWFWGGCDQTGEMDCFGDWFEGEDCGDVTCQY